MKKSELKAVQPNASTDQPAAVAVLQMFRFDDGRLSYNFAGTDAELLGLAEFAKIILSDRARMSVTLSQAQAPQKPSEGM